MDILRILMVAGMLTLAGNSYAQQGDYMNLQLAISDVDGYDEGFAAVATYGIPMPQVHENFSVEGEFSTTIADPDTTIAGTAIEVSYFTLGGYGVYSHPINQYTKLRGRVGMLYYDTDVSVGGTALGGSDDGFELTFGFGITYDLNKKMDLIAEYTVIESDISHISAGIQYRF